MMTADNFFQTGRKVEEVEEVEDIPQDISQGFEDVVDAPERWIGRKVGEVEGFGDRIDNSYDQGQQQREYRDNDRYDRY